jgi:hypothetical protein
MKSKLTLACLMLLSLIIAMPVKAFSADFELTQIGNMDLGGQKYSEWWYTGLNPTLRGTAKDSAEVTVKVDDQEFKTDASIQGDWSQPLTLGKGDYNITVSEGDNNYSFKLHLGQSMPAAGTTTETTASGSTVPDTGLNQTTALLLGSGVSLLALYFYFFESNKKRNVFEKSIVADK